MKTDDIKKFPKKFKFDAKVVDRFDDMISRSVPFHDVMREAVEAVARRFIEDDGLVVDIGCSNGRAIKKLITQFPKARFLGIETSKPMIASFKEKLARHIGKGRVAVRDYDIRYGFPQEYATPLHPDEDRSLSIPEAMRIMSFPDDFVIEGSFSERWARLGNAVPPLLAEAIGKHIKTRIIGNGTIEA